jgi:hypothetical protein
MDIFSQYRQHIVTLMCDRAEAWLVEHKEELKVAEERRCSFSLILFPHFHFSGGFSLKISVFFPSNFHFFPKISKETGGKT